MLRVNVLKGAESTLDVTDEVIIEVEERNIRDIKYILEQHGFKESDRDFTYPNDRRWYFRYVKRK